MPKSKREQLIDRLWKDKEFCEQVCGKNSIILHFREPQEIATGNPYELKGDNAVDALKINLTEKFSYKEKI